MIPLFLHILRNGSAMIHKSFSAVTRHFKAIGSARFLVIHNLN